MKHIFSFVAIVLLALAQPARATTHDFDTNYAPGQHNVLLAWTCDDKVDSQYVNLMNEYGITMTFSVYPNSVTDIDDVYDGNPYYDEWLIGWAKRKGMDFGIHDQPNAPTILASFGRDSVIGNWDYQVDFCRRWGGIRGDELPGFVWVGHQNSPELVAMAKDYGFPWTRGGATYNKNLYLNGGGWSNPSGSIGFYPPIMYYKSLIPSCSMYRLNTNGGSFSHVSTMADTTGWWTGTKIFLDSLASKGGVAILNVHPGWTSADRETVTRDTTGVGTLKDQTVPNGNKICAAGRKGSTGRNDVSAMQIAYILEAMAHWDSLKVNTEGVKRICMMSINDMVKDPDIKWRTDNTDDPDAALAAAFDSTTTAAKPYPGFTGDPLKTPKELKTVYIDGTGTVKAGNGTLQYPLPFGAYDYLFDCTAKFVGHAAGATKTMPTSNMRCGNVTFDLNGLTLIPADTTVIWMKYLDAPSNNYFLRDVEWKNGTFNGGRSAVWNVSVGDVSSTITTGVLRPARIKFKGMRFTEALQALWLQNTYRPEVDSCFFDTAPPGAGVYHIGTSDFLSAPLIRNSKFNLTGAGSSSFSIACGRSASLNWEDSVAVVNNIFITGTGTHFIAELPTNAGLAAPQRRQIRFDGNYVVSNKSSTPTVLFSHAGVTTLQLLLDSVTVVAPTFAPRRITYYTGANSAFSHTAQVDTLMWGGYTGPDSWQNRNHASIGPVQYTQPPTISLSNSASNHVPNYARLTFWQIHDLYVTRNILRDCSPLDPDTYIPVTAPNASDPSGLANKDLLLQEWKAWYDAQDPGSGDRGDIILKF